MFENYSDICCRTATSVSQTPIYLPPWSSAWPVIALGYPKKTQTPLQGKSPATLSWGVQAWVLLRSAWPSHGTHPDFGTLEPFTQFWQGLWESVWSLWVAHSASAERWIYKQPLGFGSAVMQQSQWRGKPAVKRVFCDVLYGNSDGFGEGHVLKHFWTWQMIFPQREMEGMVSHMGQSVSDVFASFFSSSWLLSA